MIAPCNVIIDVANFMAACQQQQSQLKTAA
jgi:hypothetical protein